MNIELLNRVKEEILKNPSAFDMGEWGWEDYAEDEEKREPTDCGTACCIAGWSVFLSNSDLYLSRDWDSEDACKALDINNTDLFFTSDWPEHFADQWEDLEGDDERARLAAKAIDNYIKTNGWQDEENL